MPVSMMLPANVKRSTIAAHSRGSVKVFVQPRAVASGLVSRIRFRNATPTELEDTAAPNWGIDSSGSAERRPPGGSGVVTPSSVSPLGGVSSPPLVDRGLRRGLGRETQLREPVLHVEVEPVARDNPVLDRHDVALAEPHTPARRGKSRR